ncbi:MAG: hypothetical protein BSOLF_2481 [Candidatus Carbobacillus altaicus]|uniref:Uncharacterized protein n=1 Tax=Candidatus Carbonibacillus altaicus TaxID=2163959 RepID=A0A2R6Y061_9BACL|nr:MAG: hypothetical protein BSOLF_1010 [Candidatus Carbobacillus altaicus]PTQ56920.1 MAG: hypothetical protein BSOLF_2481 [Candidatus Carbobacillus altaicus]
MRINIRDATFKRMMGSLVTNASFQMVRPKSSRKMAAKTMGMRT